MKAYTILEKKIITNILEFHTNSKHNVFSNLLFDINGIFSMATNFYFIIEKNKKVTLKISKEYHDAKIEKDGIRYINEFINRISTELIYTISLLDYLSENNYLLITKKSNDSFALGLQSPQRIYINFSDLDEYLSIKLSEYSDSYFFPLPKLYNLKENNFQDLETLHKELEKKNSNLTKWFSILSIIISLFSLSISGYIGYRQISGTQKIEITNDKLKVDVKVENKERIDSLIELIKQYIQMKRKPIQEK